MRIIDIFNKLLCSKIKKNSILFGQNITTGSRIAGMTNNIEKLYKVETINTQNSESSLIGFGFGLMLSKINSLYLVKQLDFILLGLDHIVNTLNFLTAQKIKSTFSIITYVVDSGYEGPQSRLNCLSEIASMSKANCRFLVFPEDIKHNINKINQNGFNLLCLSQKYSRDKFNPKLISFDKKGDYFQYMSGNKYTFIALGFAAYEVYKAIIKNPKFNSVDFFVVTNPKNFEKRKIIKSIKKTKNVYLFDQSKSELKSLSEIECLISQINNIKIKKFYNTDSIKKLYVNSDNYNFNIK